LTRHLELIDDFLWELFSFARPTPLGALLALAMRLDLIADPMIAPRDCRSPPPTRRPPFIGGDSSLCIGLTGKLATLSLSDMGGEGLGFFELLSRMGLGMALGQLGRIDCDKSDWGQGDLALAIFDFDLARYTTAIPPPWRIPTAFAGFLKQQG
jgi:hypothetical protein